MKLFQLENRLQDALDRTPGSRWIAQFRFDMLLDIQPKLPSVETEEDHLVIVLYFFGDFDFDTSHL